MTKAQMTKAQSKAMTTSDWQDKLADMAKADDGRSAGGTYTNAIKLADDHFVFNDADLGDSIDVVVLQYAFEKRYFDQPFNAKAPSSPACYAVGLNEHTLSPAENVDEPFSDACATCELHQWGSGTNGGRACADRVRLVCISSAELNQLQEDPDSVEYALLSLPTMSLKSFKQLEKGVRRAANRPIFSVVTNISFDDSVSYAKLNFKADTTIDDPELLNALDDKRQECEQDLLEGYDMSNRDQPVASKAPARKAPARKKRAG